MSYYNYCLIKPVEIYQKISNFPLHTLTIFLIMLTGFVICFSGYRFVHWIIGLCGFLIVFSCSFLILEVYVINSLFLTLIVSCLLGLSGGAFAIFFYKSGIFLLGVLGGCSFGIVVLSVINNPVILILLGITGGIFSLFIEKIVVVISTSSVGSLVIVWAMVRLFEFLGILSITPEFEPSYFKMVCLLTWFVLGLLGCAVQYKYFQIKQQKRNKVSK